jgi:hypothetical protein
MQNDGHAHEGWERPNARRSFKVEQLNYDELQIGGFDYDIGAERSSRAATARRFFQRALTVLKVRPSEVVTDAAPIYTATLEELMPSAWHHVERHANNPIEADHSHLVDYRAGVVPATDAAAAAVIASHVEGRVLVPPGLPWHVPDATAAGFGPIELDGSTRWRAHVPPRARTPAPSCSTRHRTRVDGDHSGARPSYLRRAHRAVGPDRAGTSRPARPTSAAHLHQRAVGDERHRAVAGRRRTRSPHAHRRPDQLTRSGTVIDAGFSYRIAHRALHAFGALPLGFVQELVAMASRSPTLRGWWPTNCMTPGTRRWAGATARSNSSFTLDLRPTPQRARTIPQRPRLTLAGRTTRCPLCRHAETNHNATRCNTARPQRLACIVGHHGAGDVSGTGVRVTFDRGDGHLDRGMAGPASPDPRSGPTVRRG